MMPNNQPLRQSPKPRPDGWWSISDLAGLKADVIAAVETNSEIPELDRAWLVAKLNERPEAALYLDAHAMSNGSDFVLHVHIQKNF